MFPHQANKSQLKYPHVCGLEIGVWDFIGHWTLGFQYVNDPMTRYHIPAPKQYFHLLLLNYICNKPISYLVIGGIIVELKLIVDGKEIDLNEYVTSMVFEVNNGILKTLRDVNDWNKMELHIQK